MSEALKHFHGHVGVSRLLLTLWYLHLHGGFMHSCTFQSVFQLFKKPQIDR